MSKPINPNSVYDWREIDRQSEAEREKLYAQAEAEEAEIHKNRPTFWVANRRCLKCSKYDHLNTPKYGSHYRHCVPCLLWTCPDCGYTWTSRSADEDPKPELGGDIIEYGGKK